MSVDRTTWEHVDLVRNLLVLGAVVHGFTIPLVWVALHHTGNRDTRARMWLVLRLLEVADREFIGAEWFRFLRRKGIRRAIWIRKDTVLDELSADERFRELQPGQFRMIVERTEVLGEPMRVVATRSPADDLVIIATDFHVWETGQLYKLRWTIESTLSSQKSRGFDLERTGVTDLTRLERLFGLVTLAWLACLRVGIWRHETKPIRVLAHGRKVMGLVRYGSEELRHVLRWVPERLGEMLGVLIRPVPALGQPGTEVVSY